MKNKRKQMILFHVFSGQVSALERVSEIFVCAYLVEICVNRLHYTR